MMYKTRIIGNKMEILLDNHKANALFKYNSILRKIGVIISCEYYLDRGSLVDSDGHLYMTYINRDESIFRVSITIRSNRLGDGDPMGF